MTLADKLRRAARVLLALDGDEVRSESTAFDMADQGVELAGLVLAGRESKRRPEPERPTANDRPSVDLYRAESGDAWVLHVDTHMMDCNRAGPAELRVYVNDGEVVYANPPLRTDDDPTGSAMILSGLAELSRTLDRDGAGETDRVQPDPLRELVSAARYAAHPEESTGITALERLRHALQAFDDLEV